MINYSCDCCRRPIDPENELRYVVRMEVYAAMEPAPADGDSSDNDHLEEIQDILQRMDDDQNEDIGEEVYQQFRFDLCPECRQRFLKNPLARDIAKQFDFSPN